MDAEVVAAIARWPNVPDVFGWLSLTARGQWRIRGEQIGNAAIRDFIGRNYASDARGRWFFQNGPQRVFASLECAPWVYRIEHDSSLRTHTGLVPSQLRAAVLVDGLTFVLSTELGAGNVDARDSERFLVAVVDARGRPLADAALEAALCRGDAFVDPARCALRGSVTALRPLSAGQLPSALGFDPLPQPA
jgi:hypothetical protein